MLNGSGERPFLALVPLPNYAFKPIAEQALCSNQTIVPQRLNAALGFLTEKWAR
jgi:hypothetical protein